MNDFYKRKRRYKEPTVNFRSEKESFDEAFDRAEATYIRAVQLQREREEARKRWEAFKKLLPPSRLADFDVKVAAYLVDQFFKLPDYSGFVVVNLATKEIKQTFDVDVFEGKIAGKGGWQWLGNLVDWDGYDVSLILLDVDLYFNNIVCEVREALETLQPSAKK